MEFSISRYSNARTFLEAVGECLYDRETINNLILGVSEQLIHAPEAYRNPFFASVEDSGGQVRCAVVMTPPHNMILAEGEDFAEAIPFLVAYLQDEDLKIPGIIGPVHITEPFVSFWVQNTQLNSRIEMNQKIYELRTVHLPPVPPGCMRMALLEDLPIVQKFLASFNQEIVGVSEDTSKESVQKRILNGQIFVWDREGQLVSMALKTRPIAHSITISGVYTPPEHRRQGYASALVARLSQHLLDSGYRFVNLFTDLANPTSNRIYRKIGYHPVCDFRMVLFKKQDQSII